MDLSEVLIIVIILILAVTIITKREFLVSEGKSEYGNISLEKDIDSFQQRTFIPASSQGEIDNQGVVDRAISGYLTQHTPNEPGVTNSSNAVMTNFYLKNPTMSKDMYIREPYESKAIDADEALSRKQQHRGDMNRKAIDGKTRSTKNIYQKFFETEGDQNEKRVWWSAEADDHETAFDLS
jgi:hypothetical protein